MYYYIFLLAYCVQRQITVKISRMTFLPGRKIWKFREPDGWRIFFFRNSFIYVGSFPEVELTWIFGKLGAIYMESTMKIMYFYLFDSTTTFLENICTNDWIGLSDFIRYIFIPYFHFMLYVEQNLFEWKITKLFSLH